MKFQINSGVGQAMAAGSAVFVTDRERKAHAFFTAMYSILVECAGARDDAIERCDFVRSMVATDWPCHEYRFQGKLGFGGKLYRQEHDAGQPFCVSAYTEDITPTVQAMIDATNARIAALCATC